MAMNDTEQKINPYKKVAILIDAMGDEVASSVLKFLDPDEIRKLGVNIPKAGGHPSPKDRDRVLLEFIERSTDGIYEKKQQLNSIYKKMLGMDPAIPGRKTNSQKIAALEWIDPKSIFDLISKEHPQTIALILTYLSTDQSVSILADLPMDMRVEVVIRMSTLDALPPPVVEEIVETLSDALVEALENLGIVPQEKAEPLGGIQFVANILKEADSAMAKAIMEKVMEASPEMAESLKEFMFVFEDIAKFDDASMQTAMKEIPKDKLSIALRIASQAVKDKIFRNMSQRAGATLKEDIEGRGGMKLSDVEAGQKAIVEVLRRMGDEGKLVLGGKKSASDALV
ncbi:MAG: flagellar motor switch protein FliG [Nitrospirota bacterium]